MAKQPTELTVQESRELLLDPAYQTQRMFEIQQRMAQMYVQSTIVPQQYRGNVGNCVIAIDMAQRMQANPLMVMQNLYVVNGNPSWSAKFLISCINSSGRFTPLRYQFTGKRGTPQYGCRAYAYEKQDTQHKEPLCSVWITMEMADKEGWTRKSGSKWLTMPDQMLIYRAAAFWQRAYAPEISMGFLTKEEAEDGIATATTIEEAQFVDASEEPQETTSEESTDQADNGFDSVSAQAAEIHRRYMEQHDSAPTPSDANPSDAIAAAMQKQTVPHKTNYRAPSPTVDTETGEIFGE